MSRILKKAVLVFLIGWVPLQASALPLAALLCGQDPAGMHGQAAAHGHHGHGGEHAGHDQHGDGDDDSSPVPLHNCCHNLTSAAVPTVTAISAAPAEGIAPAPLFHLFSFVPDQPRRPPLAA
jgi:hypothetical protein